ncbi:MAG: hypothetical protein LJE84_07145 [Gammaproteobacteria bacterium]|jgi:methylthioribose-1-phosphate isomerase|nr:hypothetical protein [Gammaproteobacteria bacterium]
MYLRTYIAALAIIAASGLAVAAADEGDKTTLEDVRQESQELAETLKHYGANQRDQALKTSRDALSALDKRMDKLETRVDSQWDQMDRAAREQARQSLRALREQRLKLAVWYGSLKQSSAGAWAHMNKGFSDAYGALQEAWKKAEQEYADDR